MIFLTIARPRPVPFRFVRDIGLGQPRAILLRQADTVIGHADAHRLPSMAHRTARWCRHASAVAHRDRIGGVLQQVGQRLADQPAVARRHRAAVGQIRVPGDLRARGPLQDQRLARDLRPISSGLITGCGMRAKAENSSTMRPISPTWRMMVSAHCAKVSGSDCDFLGEAALQPLGRRAGSASAGS